MNRELKDAADAVRVRMSLAKITQSIYDIAARCDQGDFLTRRLVRLAADAVHQAQTDRIGVADLDVAFVHTRPEFTDNETEDQHVCRYITRVLTMARNETTMRTASDSQITQKNPKLQHLHN